MYRLFRRLLFRLDAETAHSLALNLIRAAAAMPGLNYVIRENFRGPYLPVETFGLKFKNPIGLAAGYDKNGLAWRGLAMLGFGHIELGTVTPDSQPGNPRPRIFRLVDEQALINRMGFPSRGADFLRKQLASNRPKDLIIGVNLGKNEGTPLESAAEDYSFLVSTFAGLADYLVINVSSPNTLGLRRLQARQALDDLLRSVVRIRTGEELKLQKKVPLLVKLAPDLTDGELDDALQAIRDNQIDGVIATNTTTSREGVRSELAAEIGGLSGKPLRNRSTEMVRKIYTRTAGILPIIASGGVMKTSDVKEKLEVGAVLVQIYTGFVYSGPSLVRRVLYEFSN